MLLGLVNAGTSTWKLGTNIGGILSREIATCAYSRSVANFPICHGEFLLQAKTSAVVYIYLGLSICFIKMVTHRGESFWSIPR